MKEGATKLIVDRITNAIWLWSQRNNIRDIPASLFDQFIEECKLMKGDVLEIDQIIQKLKPPINHENLQHFGSNTNSPSFTAVETIVTILSAPLWVPITVFFTPFFLIGISISERIELKQYKKNKTAFMEKVTREVMEKYTEKAIYNGLSEKFIQDLMLNINKVCENIIPNKIRADRKLIENIAKQDSKSQVLQLEYFQIKLDCQKMIGKILYAKIKHFSDDPPSILKEGPILGKGSFAVVHLCDVDFHRSLGIVQCAVKRPKIPFESDPYPQLSEAENIM